MEWLDVGKGEVLEVKRVDSVERKEWSSDRFCCFQAVGGRRSPKEPVAVHKGRRTR